MELAWAARSSDGLSSVSPSGTGSPAVITPLNVATFALPEYLGHVKDSWAGSQGTPGAADSADEAGQGVVIHIQDAHCNYGAQQAIASIISYLAEHYGAKTINMEGGQGYYDLGLFTDIADKKTREKVADRFVREGLLSGAEYFGVNHPEDVTLWGIEDSGLYGKNLAAYRKTLGHKEEIDRHLNTLGHILTNLKYHIYSDELMEFDRRFVRYKKQEMAFDEYARYLAAKAKSKAIDVKAFGNFYIMEQCQDIERDIDFRRAEAERFELINELEGILSKAELEELVVKTVDFKSGRGAPGEFYQYLMRKARSTRIDLTKYAELQKYVMYISMYGAIDQTLIMSEIGELETVIKADMYENEAQRELDSLSMRLILLENLFNACMTRDDYDYYLANENDFDAENFISFIERTAPLYGVSAKPDTGIENLDAYRRGMAEFYDMSLERDMAFIRNMKNDRVNIMVTGGFHTDNLSRLFREKGISYISIIPEFRNDEGYTAPYFDLLSGKENAVEKKIAGALFSSLAIASFLNRAVHSGIPDGDRQWLISRLYGRWLKEKALSELGESAKKGLIIRDGDNALAIDWAGNETDFAQAASSGEFINVDAGAMAAGGAGLIGKFYDEGGRLIEGGIDADRVGDGGSAALAVTHKGRELVSIPLVSNGRQTRSITREELLSSVRTLVSGADVLAMPDILRTDLNTIVQALEKEDFNEVVVMPDSPEARKAKGVFSRKEKRVYIHESLAGNPLLLLHELGEGYLSATGGLTVHTKMRGLGRDLRKALNVSRILGAYNAAVYIRPSGIEATADAITAQLINVSCWRFYDKRTITESEKALMRLNVVNALTNDSLTGAIPERIYMTVHKGIQDWLGANEGASALIRAVDFLEPDETDAAKLADDGGVLPHEWPSNADLDVKKDLLDEIELRLRDGRIGEHETNLLRGAVADRANEPSVPVRAALLLAFSGSKEYAERELWDMFLHDDGYQSSEDCIMALGALAGGDERTFEPLYAQRDPEAELGTEITRDLPYIFARRFENQDRVSLSEAASDPTLARIFTRLKRLVHYRYLSWWGLGYSHGEKILDNLCIDRSGTFWFYKPYMRHEPNAAELGHRDRNNPWRELVAKHIGNKLVNVDDMRVVDNGRAHIRKLSISCEEEDLPNRDMVEANSAFLAFCVFLRKWDERGDQRGLVGGAFVGYDHDMAFSSRFVGKSKSEHAGGLEAFMDLLRQSLKVTQMKGADALRMIDGFRVIDPDIVRRYAETFASLDLKGLQKSIRAEVRSLVESGQLDQDEARRVLRSEISEYLKFLRLSQKTVAEDCETVMTEFISDGILTERGPAASGVRTVSSGFLRRVSGSGRVGRFIAAALVYLHEGAHALADFVTSGTIGSVEVLRDPDGLVIGGIYRPRAETFSHPLPVALAAPFASMLYLAAALYGMSGLVAAISGLDPILAVISSAMCLISALPAIDGIVNIFSGTADSDLRVALRILIHGGTLSQVHHAYILDNMEAWARERQADVQAEASTGEKRKAIAVRETANFQVDTGMAELWSAQKIKGYDLEQYVEAMRKSSGHFATHIVKNHEINSLILRNGFFIPTRIGWLLKLPKAITASDPFGKSYALHTTVDDVYLGEGLIHNPDDVITFFGAVEAFGESKAFPYAPVRDGKPVIDWPLGGWTNDYFNDGTHMFDYNAPGILLISRNSKSKFEAQFAKLPVSHRPKRVFYYEGSDPQAGARQFMKKYGLVPTGKPRISAPLRPVRNNACNMTADDAKVSNNSPWFRFNDGTGLYLGGRVVPYDTSDSVKEYEDAERAKHERLASHIYKEYFENLRKFSVGAVWGTGDPGAMITAMTGRGPAAGFPLFDHYRSEFTLQGDMLVIMPNDADSGKAVPPEKHVAYLMTDERAAEVKQRLQVLAGQKDSTGKKAKEAAAKIMTYEEFNRIMDVLYPVFSTRDDVARTADQWEAWENRRFRRAREACGAGLTRELYDALNRAYGDRHYRDIVYDEFGMGTYAGASPDARFYAMDSFPSIDHAKAYRAGQNKGMIAPNVWGYVTDRLTGAILAAWRVLPGTGSPPARAGFYSAVKIFVEDVLAPFVEEFILLAFLSYGGIWHYIAARAVFTIAHAFQGGMPAGDKVKTILLRMAVPALAGAAALTMLYFLPLNVFAVFISGFLAHSVFGNLMIDIFKLRVPKGMLMAVSEEDFNLLYSEIQEKGGIRRDLTAREMNLVFNMLKISGSLNGDQSARLRTVMDGVIGAKFSTEKRQGDVSERIVELITEMAHSGEITGIDVVCGFLKEVKDIDRSVSPGVFMKLAKAFNIVAGKEMPDGYGYNLEKLMALLAARQDIPSLHDNMLSLIFSPAMNNTRGGYRDPSTDAWIMGRNEYAGIMLGRLMANNEDLIDYVIHGESVLVNKNDYKRPQGMDGPRRMFETILAARPEALERINRKLAEQKIKNVGVVIALLSGIAGYASGITAAQMWALLGTAPQWNVNRDYTIIRTNGTVVYDEGYDVSQIISNFSKVLRAHPEIDAQALAARIVGAMRDTKDKQVVSFYAILLGTLAKTVNVKFSPKAIEFFNGTLAVNSFPHRSSVMPPLGRVSTNCGIERLSVLVAIEELVNAGMDRHKAGIFVRDRLMKRFNNDPRDAARLIRCISGMDTPVLDSAMMSAMDDADDAAGVSNSGKRAFLLTIMEGVRECVPARSDDMRESFAAWDARADDIRAQLSQVENLELSADDLADVQAIFILESLAAAGLDRDEISSFLGQNPSNIRITAYRAMIDMLGSGYIERAAAQGMPRDKAARILFMEMPVAYKREVRGVCDAAFQIIEDGFADRMAEWGIGKQEAVEFAFKNMGLISPMDRDSAMKYEEVMELLVAGGYNRDKAGEVVALQLPNGMFIADSLIRQISRDRNITTLLDRGVMTRAEAARLFFMDLPAKYGISSLQAPGLVYGMCCDGSVDKDLVIRTLSEEIPRRYAEKAASVLSFMSGAGHTEKIKEGVQAIRELRGKGILEATDDDIKRLENDIVKLVFIRMPIKYGPDTAAAVNGLRFSVSDVEALVEKGMDTRDAVRFAFFDIPTAYGEYGSSAIAALLRENVPPVDFAYLTGIVRDRIPALYGIEPGERWKVSAGKIGARNAGDAALLAADLTMLGFPRFVIDKIVTRDLPRVCAGAHWQGLKTVSGPDSFHTFVRSMIDKHQMPLTKAVKWAWLLSARMPNSPHNWWAVVDSLSSEFGRSDIDKDQWFAYLHSRDTSRNMDQMVLNQDHQPVLKRIESFWKNLEGWGDNKDRFLRHVFLQVPGDKSLSVSGDVSHRRFVKIIENLEGLPGCSDLAQRFVGHIVENDDPEIVGMMRERLSRMIGVLEDQIVPEKRDVLREAMRGIRAGDKVFAEKFLAKFSEAYAEKPMHWRERLMLYEKIFDDRALSALVNELVSDGKCFENWKQFGRLEGIVALVDSDEIGLPIGRYRRKAEDESLSAEERRKNAVLYDYYNGLCQHPAMSGYGALALMLSKPEEFLGLSDRNSPEAFHEMKKPSRLLEVPYIDIAPGAKSAREKASALIEGLILGKFDGVQALREFDTGLTFLDIAFALDPRMKSLEGRALLDYIADKKYTDEFLEVARGIDPELRSKTGAGLLAYARKYAGEEDLKEMLLGYYRAVLGDTRRIVPGRVRQTIEKLIALIEGERQSGKRVSFEKYVALTKNARFGVDDLLKHRKPKYEYRIRMVPKSEYLAMLTGNESVNCMAFGSGKLNVYVFNPNSSILALTREIRGPDGDTRERVLASSVVTVDRKMPVNTADLMAKILGATRRGGEGLDLHEILSGMVDLPPEEDMLDHISRDVVLAGDNVEAGVNAKQKRVKGFNFNEIVLLAYLNFFSGYIAQFPRTRGGRLINPDYAVVGSAFSVFLRKLLKEIPNNYAQAAPVSYSDNVGKTTLFMPLRKGVEEPTEPADESPLQGIRPITFEDTLDVAYVEGKAFSNREHLKSNLVGIEMELMAAAYNEALQGWERKHLSLGYYENGKLTGYILACVGTDENGDEIIYIPDYAVLKPHGSAGGRLLVGLFDSISEVQRLFTEKYGPDKKVRVRFEATTGGTGSYTMLERRKKWLEERYGFRIEKDEDLGDGRMLVELVPVTPQAQRVVTADNLIGELFLNGQMIKGGMSAREERGKLILSHGGADLMGVPVREALTEEKARGYLDDIEAILDERVNDLTPMGNALMPHIISGLASVKRIVPLEDHYEGGAKNGLRGSVMGFFEAGDGTLYLNFRLLESFAGGRGADLGPQLLHEICEGLVPRSAVDWALGLDGGQGEALQGMGHTVFRGVGKDIRGRLESELAKFPDGLRSADDFEILVSNIRANEDISAKRIAKAERARRLAGVTEQLTEAEKDKITLTVEEEILMRRNFDYLLTLPEGKRDWARLAEGVQDSIFGRRVNEALTAKIQLIKQYAAAAQLIRGVAGDWRRDCVDYIINPCGEYTCAQQEAAGRAISKELQGKFGSNTIVEGYVYSEAAVTDQPETVRRSIREKVSEVLNSMDKEENKARDPRCTLFVPAALYAGMNRQEILDDIFKGMDEKYQNYKSRFVPQKIDSIRSDGLIDETMHIVWGKGLLNFERQSMVRPESELVPIGENLMRFLEAFVTNFDELALKYGEANPILILKHIIDGSEILRIRRIDWESIREWKAHYDEVMRAL
ncbi:MAG: hypothetical protein ABH885_01235 [Candidatus Omnitrophota bacterium]